MPATIKLSTEQLKELHKIVKPILDNKGNITGWRGITEAKEHFHVKTRQTIYNWLEKYPRPPERELRSGVVPKKVAEFEETETWNTLKKHKYATQIKNTLMQAWEMLDRTDPATWTVSQIESLRKEEINGKHNELWKTETDDITPEHAVNIRRALKGLKAENAHDKLLALENVKKGGAGKRKEWYMEAEDIHRLIDEIRDLDVLTYLRIGLECGGRPISLAGKTDSRGRPFPHELRLTVDKINKPRHAILRWENKKKVWAKAKFQDCTLDFLDKYIKDHNISPDGDIFAYNQDHYHEKLKSAGIRAGIEMFKKPGTGAYTLRHTFATQGLSHNLSIEGVMQSGGWDTSDVIMAYYAGLKEEKMDLEFLDIKPDVTHTWKSWISQFDQHFKDQYQKILTEIVSRKKTPTAVVLTKVFKGYTWGWVKGMLDHPEKIRPATLLAWRKAYKLHNQGMTDLQIRHEMGWDKKNSS
jgi:hypothetical protein